MKKTYKPYYLVLFVLISVCSGLKSQNPFVDAAGERIEVCTDRSTYISGEKVLFSAVIFNHTDHFTEPFSRVFYCELITPDGNRIAGGKYLLQNFAGQGSLTIPEETISGIYFLKFYTRFMRNISTDEYTYIILKIINPFKTEVLSGSDVLDTTNLAWNPMEVQTDDKSLNILSSKKSFSPREEIRLDIRVNIEKGLPAALCLSVIPEFTYNELFFPFKSTPDQAKNGLYFPETRGISMSGQLIGKESGKPVPNANVYLSIIGDKDILVINTDSTGRFFFALPDYHGSKDIFLCAEDLPDITPEILIDNDFCTKPVHLPSPLFTLNEEEMKAAYKLAVNSRITSLFREDAMAGDSLGEEINTSFYGKPSEVLIMEKYIDLPTLEEYFTELTVMVKVKKSQGRKQFRFFTSQAEMSMFDPLVLVDWVAVDDIEKILTMSPLDIDRIELVNAPYIKGNITYGGIISIVSKKNDFAGIDLPTSGTFVNYRFLEACTKIRPPDSLPVNIPDSRNTVYWNPSVQTNDAGAASISFPAPDTPGNYLILLRRITPAGEVLVVKKVIEVMGH